MTARDDDASVTSLALSAGRGDPAALTEFIRLTQADVWRFVAHLTDADAADDLTQETFLRAISALPRFSARAPARVWLISIARRAVVDRIRYEVARPRIAGSVDWQSALEAQPAALDVGAHLEVRRLLDLLDPERREALVLTQVLGFTYQEAADICRCRIGTIRSRVARARAQFVAAWAADADEVPAGVPQPH